jgi:hypothetical protein
MLSVAHAPTGAFIATKIPNPLISIPLIILAHYLEDRVPHWDVGTGMKKSDDCRKVAFYNELFYDFPGSILIVYFFFQYGHSGINWLAWMGWFFALLPDFLESPINFLNLNLPPFTYLSKIHKFFHHSTPNKFLGLLPQIAVILLIYLLK